MSDGPDHNAQRPRSRNRISRTELEKEAEAARTELGAVRKAALADIDALRAQLAELGNDVEILHDEKAQMHEKLRHTQAVHSSLLADHNQLLVQQRRAETQIRSLEHELEKMRKHERKLLPDLQRWLALTEQLALAFKAARDLGREIARHLDRVAAEDAADVAAENAAIEAAAAGIEGEGGAEAAAKAAEAAAKAAEIRAKGRRHAEVAATTLAPLLDQFDTALEASVPNLVVAKPWLADLLLPLQRSLHGMTTALGSWREKTPPQPHRPANLGTGVIVGAIARQVENAVSGTGAVVGAMSGGLSPAGAVVGASKRGQRGAKRGAAAAAGKAAAGVTAAPPSTAAAAGASASCIWEEFSTAGSGAGSSTSASRVNTPLPPRQARGSAAAAGASAGASGEGGSGDANKVALPPGLMLVPQNTSEANAARPDGMAIGAVPTTTLNLDVEAGLPPSPTGFPPRAASLNGTAGAAALSASWKLGSGVAFPGSRSMGSLYPPGSAVAGQYNESRRRGASPTPGLAQTYGRTGGNWRQQQQQQQQQQQSMAHSGWRGAPLMPPTAPILVKAPPNAFLPKAARESLPDFLHPYRYQ